MERKRNINSFTNITNLYLTLSFFLMLLVSTLTFKSSTATTISCLDASKCSMFAKFNRDYQDLNSFYLMWHQNGNYHIKICVLGLKCAKTGAEKIHCDWATHEKYKGKIGQSMVFEGKTKVSLDWARRFLGGPGSSPPQCTSKCGKCTPCRPVHVPVPPGTPVTAEYYPEAWRCKCGNKLNMP